MGIAREVKIKIIPISRQDEAVVFYSLGLWMWMRSKRNTVQYFLPQTLMTVSFHKVSTKDIYNVLMRNALGLNGDFRPRLESVYQDFLLSNI